MNPTNTFFCIKFPSFEKLRRVRKKECKIDIELLEREREAGGAVPEV